MPNEKAPCPFCGELIWVYYPNNSILKSVERDYRALVFSDLEKSKGSCPECGKQFYVYFDRD